MAYTAKYASSLYGPFRDILNVNLIGDKKSYQMNPANRREAIRELELDLKEGADIVMVKPASWYLDVISDFKSRSQVPVAAYQVSGECALIELGAQNGLFDRSRAIMESLVAIKRSGADLILTYHALEAAELLG
jgi:porphobilinogen synthase